MHPCVLTALAAKSHKGKQIWLSMVKCLMFLDSECNIHECYFHVCMDKKWISFDVHEIIDFPKLIIYVQSR